MFLCVNCGNNIQSSNKQLKISIKKLDNESSLIKKQHEDAVNEYNTITTTNEIINELK